VTAAPDLRLNPQLRLRRIDIGTDGEQALIVDAVLNRPDALIDYARWDVAFTPAGRADGGYPGVRAPAPSTYVEAVVRGLGPHIADSFSLGAVRPSGAECALSLTTLPPAQLTIGQRAPHVDTSHGLQFALLHYLCDARFGGTSFYRHRATGFEAITPEREARYDAVRAEELACGPPPWGYVGDGDPCFERIGGVDAVFDRLVIYRSRLLHSIDVDPAVPLPPDPQRGRLTANIFLTFRPG
jgi:hypothetical protein